MDYPAQVDCVWLASDNFGRLAAIMSDLLCRIAC
jgi:hypothetical protein